MANRSTLRHGATDVSTRGTARGTLRAVDYLRVSTEEQKKGYGVASQGRKTVKYIRGKGWHHVDTYIDEGISGSLDADQRPSLKRLMDAAHQGTFDVVVVKEGRAIGRTGRAFWRWVWTLEDTGIFVAIVDGDVENTSPEGRREMRRQADYSETEWETIRTRTQGGLQEKAEDAGTPHIGGKPPYGYRIADQGKVRASHLVIDKAEAATVRRVHHLVTVDGLNLRQITICLNAEGVTTRSGLPWSRSNLRDRIMSRAVLDGIVVFRGDHAQVDAGGNPVWGERVTIPIPRILTEEEASELRKKVAETARPSSGKVAFYSLSGRLFGLCGAPYTGHSRESDTPRERFYRCSGKTAKIPGGKVCRCSYISAEAIETRVWSEIVGTISDSTKLSALAAEWIGMAQRNHSTQAERVADLDHQIARMNASITAVIVATAKEKSTEDNAPAAIQAATAALNAELAQLQEMRDEATDWLTETEESEQRARDLLAMAGLAQRQLKVVDARRQADFMSLVDAKISITGPVPVRRGGIHCPVRAWYKASEVTSVPGTSLTDGEWETIAPLLHKGRRDAVRQTVNTIFHKARSGLSWNGARASGVHPRRAADLFRVWASDGTWTRVESALKGVARVPIPVPDLLPPIQVEVSLDPRLMLLPGTPSPRES